MENFIEIKNITKTFNENTSQEFTPLKNISFNIKKNETFFLKGVSGSGKSTLLGLIAGLYKPTFGDIVIGGESISKLSLKFASKFRRKNIGIIFQNFNLIPTLSVIDNILLPTLPDKNGNLEYIKELLDRFGIYPKIKSKALNLSGGEQQRVAIIRALVNNPSIILADEPTANLDKALSQKLIEYFSLMKDKTIIISTHDPFLLESGFGNDFYELKKD